MRVLLLLRGAAGCGKSTWIERHGLKHYALCADDIRMMCSGPKLDVSGKPCIDQTNDAVVWKTLFSLLEIRMQNGEFTVIDATNSKTSEMNRYKELCIQHKYRIYCVDFTDIPIETVKERNRQRPELKRVPDEAIEKMYARFETQKIPSGITVLKPDELDRIWLHKIDLSQYRRINVIGDIHGCYEPLHEFLERTDGFRDDEFYIFCGDYLDRGLQNAAVLRLLMNACDKDNILLLEGNHERWLWIWANGGVCPSKEFELVTKTELEQAGFDKKEVRKFYRRIGQCAWFDYHGEEWLVTHAGISTIPENLTLVSTSQMVKGVGSYNRSNDIAESFVRTAPVNCYQVHGHRNVGQWPAQVNDRCFNLEGHVEFGGDLRVLQIEPGGKHDIVEIRNTLYRKPETIQRCGSNQSGGKSVGDVVIELRKSKFIREKQYGNISSFNFTKDAFYDKVWDEQTTKARGLYINVPKQKVVARAYEKFFNVNERPETKLDMLQYKLAFPVTAYVKENGFLGLVSWNEEDDSLFVTTKSSPDGDFAQWLRDDLRTQLGDETLAKIKEYAKEHNVTFVFECVDMKNDPHVIDYPGDRLYLLDIIYNEMNCRKLQFEELCAVADELGLTHKEKAFVLDSWQDFYSWYYTVTAEDYLYEGRHIEGFVVEDANGYMVKLKLAYYNFWKFMRSIAHEAIRKGYIDPRRTAALTTPLANHFYAWARTLHDTECAECVPHDICTLRRLFFETETGKLFAAENT